MNVVRCLSWAAALSCVALAQAAGQGLRTEQAQAPSAPMERGAGPRGGTGDMGEGMPGRGHGARQSIEQAQPESKQRASEANEPAPARPRAEPPSRAAQSSGKSEARSKKAEESNSEKAGPRSKDKEQASDSDGNKQADEKRAGDDIKSDKPLKSQAPKAQDRQEKTAGGDKRGEHASESKAEAKPAKEVEQVKLSGRKRDRVRQAFRDSKVKERTDVDVHISVGRRLPSSWHYYPVPETAIGIAPEYQGYVYVYVDDSYVICEPDTYEVVAVVDAPAGYASGGDQGCPPNLELSSEERDDIARSVSDTREVDVRDLDVGWSVPQSIELHRFPDRVLDRNGELRQCRYFVAQDDVAVVDPDEEKVVLLIDAD